MAGTVEEEDGPPPMIPAPVDGFGAADPVCGSAAEGAAATEEHGPRSTSSAMPDLESPNVPRLQAKVHQRLTAAECASIPLSELQFRPLQAEDYDEMVALHTEWFPVSYDEAFYNKSTQGELFTLVATHAQQGGSSSSAADESILGMITMSTQCEHHAEDMVPVLGADCSQICEHNHRHFDPEDGVSCHRGGSLAYILTLGVADGFRRRGLAKELLRQAIMNVDRNMPEVQAVYLHVVTYNEAAIQLYEAMNFYRIDRFVSFYNLHGKPYDSFLYAMYIHSGRPPWKWRIRNFLGMGTQATWREWVVSAVSSLWRGDANGAPMASKDGTSPAAESAPPPMSDTAV